MASYTSAERLIVVKTFYKNNEFVVFSDEAHFQMNGYVNKQNCRYWSEKIHKNFKKQLNIPKKSLFGVDFAGEESLVHTSLKTIREMRSPLILSATEA